MTIVLGPAIGFAHRGARALERDNTLEAFRRALELGATGLESDVWTTADGQAVLDHDGWTSRWPLVRRRIAAVSRAQLPGHVPSLAELVALAGPGVELSVDVKDPAAIEAVWAALSSHQEPARVWLVHPSLELLSRWRRERPGVRYVNSVRLSEVRGDLDGWLARAAAAGVDAVNLRHSEWTAERVASAHRHGLRAFAWDAQRSKHLERVLDFGVDAVYSDHVGRMMAALARRTGAPHPEGR